ncbi:MAG: tetratricopeptide repeat protein [Chitinophagaceae bacterium]
MVSGASFVLFAQPSYTLNDSIRIYKWLDKSDRESLTGSLDTSLNYARLALQISKEKKMLRGEGMAKLKIADIMSQQESKEDFTGFFTEGLRIGTLLKDSFMMALACYQHGQHLMYNNQLDAAEKLYQKSLLLKFGREQSSYTGLVYNDMGYLFGLRNDLENKVTWLLKAIKVLENSEDMNVLGTAYSNLGSVYFSLGNKSKALDYTRNAIAIREKAKDLQGLAISYQNIAFFFGASSPDSANKYEQLGLLYAEKTGIKSMMIRSYANMSVTMSNQHNKPEALVYIKKSIALCREFNKDASLADKCRWAALLCADMKDSVGMEAFTQEAYDISIKLNNKTLLRDLYASKASNNIKFNDYKSAYENLKKYYLYRDSIVSEKTTTNIAELQTKYETEKKDNEISKLTTAQKIRQLEIEKQKAIISGNKLEASQKENEIALLSKTQELQDSRIQQQSEELEKQTLLAKYNQQQLTLSEQSTQLQQKQLENQKQLRDFLIVAIAASLVLGFVLFNRYQLKKKLQQQNELLSVRNNIAKDLHDDIGSTLTSIKILSEVSKNNLDKDRLKASSFLQKISDQSAEMQQGMSDIVWAIKPANDKFENMVIRMREYISHTLESKNINAVFNVDQQMLSKSIGMQQRRDFFLIFKEVINNAAKYSGAGTVTINLEQQQGNLLLSVSDNGIGFDTSKITSSNGLSNIYSRAEALKGHADIFSAPGKGTQIRFVMPTT